MIGDATPRWATALTGALIARWRWFVVAVVIVVCVAAIFAGRWFRADNSARVWLLEDDPAMVAYDDFLAQFGNDEVVLLAVVTEDGVYTPEVLDAVRRASARIARHPKIRRVASVTASSSIEGDALEIRVDPLVPDDGPVTPALADEARRRVAADPILSTTLVSDDERVTLIAAQMQSLDQVSGQRPAILEDLRAIAREELRGPRRAIHLGGIGVIYDAINRAVLRDTRLFISLSYLLILGGLWVMFRRLGWVLLALAIVGCATVATAGLFGALDRKLNMVTSIVPTLILTVGVLDLIHLLAARRECAGHDAAGALSHTVVPCVFNTVTDAIGFLALVSAPMAGVRDFGLLAALGLCFLLAVTLVFAVPLLARDARVRGPMSQPTGPGWTLGAVLAIGRFAVRRRVAVVVAGVLVIGLGGFGATRIVVDTYNLEFLDAEHPTRVSHGVIEDRYGLYIPVEMTVRAADGLDLKDPGLLRRVQAAERAIEAHPEVDRVTGLPEVITRLNEVVMDGDPSQRVIPDDRRAVAQQLILYEGDEDAALDRLVDPHYRVARISGRIRMATATGVQRIIDDIEAIGARQLGDQARLEVAGYLSLYVRIVDTITRAQVRSFGIAFALVAIVLMLLLRSVRLGLVAMVPNLVPALSTLGLMGALGIRLDVGTVLVASLAIGISVNDTSHLMFRFARDIRLSPGDPAAALERSLRVTGRAIFASSIVLMLGFGVLAFGSTNSIRIFGVLSSATVGFALIADLVLTPALLALVYSPRRSGSPSNLLR